MIELTEQQIHALEPATMPTIVLNPLTQETFVLLRSEEYKRLRDEEYDDSPWTPDELLALAWEAGKSIGWDDMDECDDLPEKK